MVSERDKHGNRQLNIALPEKYHHTLKKVSFEHGITVSDIIRKYCAYLHRTPRKDLRPLDDDTKHTKFRFD